MGDSNFFDEVIAASGISTLFAPRALRKALERAKMRPDELSAKTLEVALPEIEAAIRLYLGPDADPHVERVRSLLRT